MDIVPTCRACLKTSLSYIDLETPFEQSVYEIDLDSQPNTFTTYMDCFRACTQLGAAYREDEMPQSVCEECGFELAIAWNFRKKAVQSDKILKDNLENLDIKDNVKVLLVGNVKEHHTENTIVADVGSSAIVPKEEKNNEIICSNEDVTKDIIIVDDSENEGLMVFCFECNIYFNSKFEHNHHISSTAYQLNTTLNPDHSQNNKKAIETRYAGNKNESPILIEGEKYGIMELVDVGVDNREDYVECEDNTENITNEDNIDNILEPSAVFCCSTCFQTFETRRGLLHHSRTHTADDGKVTICKICNQKVTKGETSRKHMRNAHSAIIQCSQCDYRCQELKMTDHVIRTHDNSKSFSCNICDKTFNSQSLLNTHHKYHKRKEANIKSDACEICGKRFSTQHYLRLHMEVHRNERQLRQCEYCDKIYVSKIALENHIRLHKGETINCDQCGKQFVRQYELNVHMRFHTRDYPFKCEVCGKKFAIKGHLRTHMWRHQGLKLQCEECGKLFTSTKALQEHSFVHSEMPFPCSYCGRGYPSKQKFKVHLKTTHLIELTEEELLKVTKLQTPKPLQRKKLTLVQADSVMKEIEVKDSGAETANEGEDILVELC